MHKVIHVCAKELVASKKDRYCIELFFFKESRDILAKDHKGTIIFRFENPF